MFRLRAFQTLLDGSRDASEQKVELSSLRRLCARGIPEHPSHLRPLAYSLLLGILPADKRQWKRTARRQREQYYSLAKTFLEEAEAAPASFEPLSRNDALLVRIAKDIERVDLPVLRTRTVPSRSSPLAPPPDAEGVSSPLSPTSSDSDDGPVNEDAARTDSPVKTQRRRSRAAARAVEPLLSRRALFTRLEWREDTVGHGRAPSVKGKEKATDSGQLPPRIVLSHEKVAFSPTDTAAAGITPSLSLTIPNDHDNSRPPSPITLLSPKLVANGQPSAFPTSSILLADKHSECLTRLLYIFLRTNPQYSYGPNFVDIVVPLYLVYSETRFGKAKSLSRGRYAEEETYWAFTALMAEFGDIVGLPAGDDSAVTSALERLGRRVRWADEQLWTTLRDRNLNPASPLYSYQWITGLLTHDRAHLLPLWDFVFAEPPCTPDSNPKVELLVDICTAMIGLCKKQVLLPPPAPLPAGRTSMWQDVVGAEPKLEPEDPEAAFVRCLQLFRNYPLDRVGGVSAVLNTAFELSQARRAAQIQGDDPDTPGWMEARDDAVNRPSWASAALRGASASTGKLWSHYTESDTAASLAKASSNWTASAISTWQATGRKVTPTSPPESAAGPGWTTKAAGWFGRKRDDDDVSVSGSEYDSNASSPTKAMSPGHNNYTSIPAAGVTSRRNRSDSAVSNTSALSVTSLQEKLTGIASSLTGSATNTPQQRVTSGPRPLLLSGAARRASNNSQGGRSPRMSPQPNSNFSSPPGSIDGHRSNRTSLASSNRPSYPIGLAKKSRQSSLSSGTHTPPVRRKESIDTTSTYNTFESSSSSLARSAESVSSLVLGAPIGLTPLAREYAESTVRAPSPTPAPASVPAPAVQPPLPTTSPAPASPTEPITIPTPQIAHLTEDDYEHVYEPAEDSFILLDALEADAAVLRDLKPALAVEIGSGSGIASTFVATMLGDDEVCILSTDINKYASDATKRTAAANDVYLNPVLSDLLTGLKPRITGKVDLLIFNPPYVETEETERAVTQDQRDIGGAWAGGQYGMTVTNKILQQLPSLLAPGGRFYLVAIHQNKPDEIIARMRAVGLECKTMIKRRAGRELLSVIRMIRPAHVHAPVVAPIVAPTPTPATRVLGPRKQVAAPVASPQPARVGEAPAKAPRQRESVYDEEDTYGDLLDAYDA
ncbi:S-adenosylmethionine-dependent methyltransferase [Vanrija albida]|uniref:S-adenosylmethionine-dependent methyltransferase n=1 Tax=Vanrija albida TaxID=181172 RepID=A0ABR3PWS2_9TREE